MFNFINPWFMVAGCVLVSLPIIIHLINRMRFKRVRWAAIEFLLKSQKRNRRRLIIEQLILLLLRILMVLLVAFLVARWTWGSDTKSAATINASTTSVIIIDDSLSMSDRRKANKDKDEKGTDFSAWTDACAQVKLLVNNAYATGSTQEMRIFLLSDLEKPLFHAQLSNLSENEIDAELKKKKPTFYHLAPLDGLNKGFEILHAAPNTVQKFLYIVSDFRKVDWESAADSIDINAALDKLVDAEPPIVVNLIDSANPERGKTLGEIQGHDNVAILSLKPSRHVVTGEGANVVFTATIYNFGSQAVSGVSLDVDINGAEFPGGHKPFDPIQPKKRIVHEIRLSMPTLKTGTEYVKVRARLKIADSPLPADDVRDAVVYVRQTVPILVIDGTGIEGPKDPQFDRGDWKTLEAGLTAGKKYVPRRETVEALEKLDLNDFPTIYLLDVPPISNEATLKKLQKYVEIGGNLVYFLGPKTQPSFLNELHTERKGLFPILIEPKPVDLLELLLASNEERRSALSNWVKTKEGKEEVSPEDMRRLMHRVWIQGWDPRDEERRAESRPPRINPGKILFRDPKHPMVSAEMHGLAEMATYYYDNLLIGFYYRPGPSLKWAVPADEVTEVISMPQVRSSIDEFKDAAQKLGERVEDKVTEIVQTEPDFDKYREVITRRYRVLIRKSLDEGSPALLDRSLELMLEEKSDPRRPDAAKVPDMPKLWAHPKMKDLKPEIIKLRDRIRFGDPLVLSRKYRLPYKLTDESLAELRAAKMPPESVMAKLKEMKGKEFENKEKFLTELSAILDKDERERFQDDVLALASNKDDERCGTTVVVMTTAGTAPSGTAPRWNEWASGPAQWSYPNFIRPLQVHLDSQGGLGDIYNRVLERDKKLELSFEKDRYDVKKTVKVTFFPQERAKEDETKTVWLQKELPALTLETRDEGRQWLTLSEVREPGFYSFELTPKTGTETEVISLAYNVDANAESDLTRTATEKLRRDPKNEKKGKVVVVSPDGSRKEAAKKTDDPDASGPPWVYLILLLVLVAEQAMAVHLSFHLKSSEAGGSPTPAKAAA